MTTEKPYACANCAKSSCLRGDFERMPTTCPTRTDPDIASDATPYSDEANHRVMIAADATPISDDGQKRSRVEERAAYAKSMGMQRIGIAFCVSLTKEAQKPGRILRERGLSTELVCCRVGAIDRRDIELSKPDPERFSGICNPVAQAKLLNERKVDLVALVGLCIGHDLILHKECNVPITTLVVKDRALDHHSISDKPKYPTSSWDLPAKFLS
jgi:uncharacterized metal-binding protein